MAITAGTTVETFSGTAGTSHTINLPTYSADDVVCIDISANPDGTGTRGTLTIPTGWTSVATPTEHGAASTGELACILKVMTGSEGSTLGLTYDNAVMVQSVATPYTGVDTSTPQDATAPAMGTGTSGNAVSPSITTVTDGALVRHAVNVDGTGTVSAVPSGDTQRGTLASNNPPSNGQNTGSGDNIQTTAGASGTATWTNGSEEWVAATYAIRPITISNEIDGITYDEAGSALGSCTVTLWKDNGDDTITYYDRVTSNASTGAFTFSAIPSADASFFIVATKADTPDVVDVSERTIQPAVSYSGTVDLYLRSQVDKSETAGDGDMRLRSQADKESTGTEVLATTDALILTENAATVNAALNVSANTDALTLSTLTATVNAATNVQVATDSLSLTEQPATVNAATNVQAGLDVLTLTEQPASVNAETNVLAGLDSLTLTEQPATITISAGIVASTDVLVLTEFAATVNAANNIQINLDALTLTEYQAGVQLSAGTNVLAGVDVLNLVALKASIAVGGVGDYGVVSHGTGVTLGRSVNHMHGVGGPYVSTPLGPENET